MVLVIINIVAIYGPLNSNTIILYQITQLSEQKYRLAVPFAENNFGPFEHIVFVIVLLESPLKTLFRVLFASLYLQIAPPRRNTVCEPEREFYFSDVMHSYISDQ